MSLLTNTTPVMLWHDIVKHAEGRCSVSLSTELEVYLISLLVRYTNKPEIAKQILATAFLKALQYEDSQRNLTLQTVGDQCLLFAGFFPRAAEKRLVKLSYFVDLGRSAYGSVTPKTTNDLFAALSLQFVVLMDVLQSIRHHHDLLPLEAYELWNEVGSQRALRILQEYTSGTPQKDRKR